MYFLNENPGHILGPYYTIYAAFIRTGDYRISQFTTREERSFEAEVRVIMGNIP